MNKRCIVTLLALTLAILSWPFTAQAGDVVNFSGKFADASFSSTDLSGCIRTDVSVFATDGKFQTPPETGTATSWGLIFISQYNSCTDTPLMDGVGFSEFGDAAFHVVGSPNSATLNTTLNICDSVSSSCFDVFVDLTWIATGAATRSPRHYNFHSRGFIVNSHYIESVGAAQASGSVADGATNFTPNPADSAEIGWSRSGQVEVS